VTTGAESALDDATLDRVRDLILVLADSKRLLGYRYAEWMLGAPELETGIACSSMAQDEWGHARLLYALLKGFDDDVDALEHGREADAYRNMEPLDEPCGSWTDVVALMTLVDMALTVQFEALRTSRYAPLRQRVEKLLEEEGFHEAHGGAWLRRLAAGGEAARAAMRASMEAVLPTVLRWFGPDSDGARELVEAGVMEESGSALRSRFLQRVEPHLDRVGIDGGAVAVDFEAYDEAGRRGAGGPDPETIEKIRGDRNRVFLMDG
jgi:ring-1,2-phenylacetyl-CoA epoxidase subunit PaaC